MRLLLAPLVLAALVGAGAGASSCAVGWWPQPRQSSCGNAGVANAAAPSPGNVGSLAVAWTVTPDPGAQAPPTTPLPVVWKGPKMPSPFVYFGVGRELHALDLATGALRWKARGSPARPLADGALLLQHTGAVLRQYVPRSGHIVWQRTVKSQTWGEPIAAGGNVYIEDNAPEGRISAYDERTGRVRWQRWFGCFNCRLAAAGDRLYAAGVAGDAEGNGKGRLYALDAKTGATVWSARADGELASGASPVLVGNRIYIRTMAGKYLARTFAVDAFDATTGRHLWRAPVGTSKAFWFGLVAADESTVVYPSEDGNLYALSASDGSLRWKAPDVENGVMPAIVNGIAWASDLEGRLVAYDIRNGTPLWRSETLWDMSSNNGLPGIPGVVVAGSYVLAGATDGRLVACHVRPYPPTPTTVVSPPNPGNP